VEWKCWGKGHSVEGVYFDGAICMRKVVIHCVKLPLSDLSLG